MLYLDYGATTPLRSEVQREMEYYFAMQFANPHSPHDAGLAVKKAVEGARRGIAKVLGVYPRQVIFTSGGTEANNLAIFGVARRKVTQGCRLLTTTIEHKSVLAPLAALAREGFEQAFIPVDTYGSIDLQALAQMLLPGTVLVALAHANNEIGTVQPIDEAAQLLRRKGIHLHCDAVQSFGKIPVQFADLGVDSLTISGHKIYGPKGIGVLVLGSGVQLQPLIYGGEQERGIRPGTLNVPAIMGLAKAVELAAGELAQESSRLKHLRDLLINEVTKLPGVRLNGHPERRLPNNINLAVKGIEGQVIVAELAVRNIAISSGAACSSGSLAPSHVLSGLGQPNARAYEGFRITLGRTTGREDIFMFITALSEVIMQLQGRFQA